MTKDAAETGTRLRTRTAILDAAARVFAASPAASLGEIAAAAEVGRTTLHRYFPERHDLLRALARHVITLSEAAVARARPDSGPPLAALRRVVEEQFALGPILLFIYNEPTLVGDTDLWDELIGGDDPVDTILTRAGGPTAPALPAGWARRTFWALLYTGWEAAKEDGLPRHEVVDAIMTSLTRGVLAPEPTDPRPH
ncbi:TetR/AcrR family transcriptional regulator [Embleya sp. NPDC050154]|uniref:TetR/AcrR family transcriptional regulator n=1 Tax=unclassified Embleya TaxID=2699296 RepID=UPI0037A91FDB